MPLLWLHSRTPRHRGGLLCVHDDVLRCRLCRNVLYAAAAVAVVDDSAFAVAVILETVTMPSQALMTSNDN